MEITAFGRIAAGAALVLALAYWAFYTGRGSAPDLAGALVKTGSVALLALVLWQVAMRGGALPLFWLVALGLTLGALGDFCLARSGEAWFLAGMGAFGAGHLAYALALILRGRALGSGLAGVQPVELLVLAALVLLILSTEIWLAPRTGGLLWPVRAYVLLIALMGLAAILLPAAPGQGLIRLGAALFLASDLMLAIGLFVAQSAGLKTGLSLALWPAYWAAQALIGLGALRLWAPTAG